MVEPPSRDMCENLFVMVHAWKTGKKHGTIKRGMLNYHNHREIMKAWRTATQIFDVGPEAYFRMDAREKRQAVRGGSWMTEEMYDEVAAIC